METAKHFVAYYRVSTPRQGVSGLGLEAQRAAALRHIGHGVFIAEYTDIESGKRHENRPQLLAALHECRVKKAMLVIAKLDRLGRNVAFISALMESGVDFVCCDNPHANRLMLHMLAAFAEHERELISARTKECLAAAKARGVKLGNPRLHEARARAAEAQRVKAVPKATLSLMLDLRAQKTLRQIAVQLNSYGFKSPGGGEWHASTVRATLLRNSPDAYTSSLKEGGKPGISSAMPLNAGRKAIAEGMFMPSDLKEAERMLNLFTSVGARSFVVTKLDIEQQLIWAKTYSALELREKLPAMVRTAEIRRPHHLPNGETVMAGENLIVRPVGDVAFVQLDDLNAEQLERVRQSTFLIHSTSPGNYQAWIAADDVAKSQSKEFIRRVRMAVGDADKSASGATRLSGTFNFKQKYAPEYPLVTTVQGVPGRVMTQERLQGFGLLAEPEPMLATEYKISSPPRVSRDREPIWPDYGRCLQGAPMGKDGPDRSRADWTFCLFAARRGVDASEIEEELLVVSQKAQERKRLGDQGYASVTAKNAVAAVDRERQRSRA